ncbi:TPA: hypothetical protein IX478_002427 [Enterococcus faecium]|uniref:hypothetical protein n=1 Tax=Enterococcus TaxID=1350 RepID=UPI000FD7DFCE|nr:MULTISPECIES: hypothetical protein [Enterococcus]MDT2681341.1 hypothetical protein [Enterococcus gallinarum]MDT2684639.1 hypothetical protein [Enterococcus gallinarum]HAQ1356604.1 hypothetical protein [Enterococcus faecium]HAQ4474335.1 hypothetical protein [Enterococcus faecium]HAQ4619300.1 hypothetical protein [Enterococcus faecium]
MNEKIQRLIEELAEECHKENVGLSLATLDVTGELEIAQVGSESLVSIAALEQYNQVKEELTELDCDCPKHRMLKELYGIEMENTPKKTHTFVIDNPNDVLDIISRALRGEFK